jgi:hypothetical protein
MPDPNHKTVDLRLCHYGTIFHCSPLRTLEEGGGFTGQPLYGVFYRRRRVRTPLSPSSHIDI